jgi:hypothetical protein
MPQAVPVDGRPTLLFGGPHVNSVLARLASSLPFTMQRGKLTLGHEVFEGDEYRLITVIPSRPPDACGPGYPEFLLYVGTGSPGVAEINAVRHGGESILVVDTFGRLLSGKWRRTPDGQVEAHFPAPRARRIAWRTVEQNLPTPGAKRVVRFRFAWAAECGAAPAAQGSSRSCGTSSQRCA